MRGGRAVFALGGGDFDHLQPVLRQFSPASHLIYEWLVIPDPANGEPRPGLARWQVSADALTYTWEIDPAAVWSDGTPIMAADWLTAVKAVARTKHKPIIGADWKRPMAEIVGFEDYRGATAMSISGIEADGGAAHRPATQPFLPIAAGGLPPPADPEPRLRQVPLRHRSG